MRASIAFVTVVALAAGAVATPADIFQYNLIVTGNLDTNQEVEGRTIVGGNLTGPSAQFGFGLLPRPQYLGIDVLTVGGNINMTNIQMEAGDLRRAGTRNANLNFNGGGTEIVDASVAGIGAARATDLVSLSSFYSGLIANSTIQAPNGQPAPLKFFANPDADGVAVFSISASTLASNLVQQIELTANGATSIIVNVTGATLNFNQGNFVGAWASQAVREITLWNFADAADITLDRHWNGAILAPHAHLTNTTAIEGSVYVSSMTMRGEVHLPLYTGITPTPGTFAMLGLAGLAGLRRRR
ncbi:MAG: choice-of-anchor A family protein [Phycisphaeraceae bacterium]|nr:choice-of-anchor A family protein [Phycisphaeraceae bacterium]